ncbi:MAG: hypothetical protein ACR2FY_13815 [Pirellulaceae bacterium]
MPISHPVPSHTSADFATPATPPPALPPSDAPKSPAEKLLALSGSPDQAKQAVDAAARERAAGPVTKEDFARRWGFASFLEMFEASKPSGPAGVKGKWLVTALRGGKWLLWNDGQMESAQEFESRDAALAYVPQANGGANGGANSEGAKVQG